MFHTMRKKLTEAQFSEAVKGLDVGERTLAIAKGVLVEGESQASYVKKFGLTRGAVSQAVNRVYARAKVLPPGYEKVTAVLPSHRAYIVRKWEAENQKDSEK